MPEHKGRRWPYGCRDEHQAITALVFRGRFVVVWWCPKTGKTWTLPLGRKPYGK